MAACIFLTIALRIRCLMAFIDEYVFSQSETALIQAIKKRLGSYWIQQCEICMLTLQQFGNFGPSIYTTKCMVHSLLFHLDLLSLMLFWSRCKLLFWRGGGSCFKVTKEKQKAKCFLLKKHKQRTLCWLCPNCSGLFRSKIESWEAVNGWTTQTKPIYSLIKHPSFI